MNRTALPIDIVLPDLLDAVRSNSSVVLQAPTGAGKTTRVPPALLDAGWAKTGQIVMLEPRRLAARAAARRMAKERQQALGDLIGYQVRFDRQAGPNTKILVVTPGIVLRMIQEDPFLETIQLVIFDEFHERGLENDLVLGMVRLLQQTVRNDLRILVMSATLETHRISQYLGNCPIVTSEGKLFPVEVKYEAKPTDQPWPLATAHAVQRTYTQTDGDLLVFLPGLGEIRQTIKELEPWATEEAVLLLPLHGDLPPEQQDAALQPQDQRKIVLATNVAETSVTVEGITAVIDTGLARHLVFDPTVGLDRLELVPISQASADQRKGRAGRTQPGICVRLWSEVSHSIRPLSTEPEIQRVDLAGALLQLFALGETKVTEFPWIDPPPRATVEQGLQLLHRLQALDDSGLTELGQQMAWLPVHPRLARLLIEAERLGCVAQAALATAFLSERDPFVRSIHPSTHLDRFITTSDILDKIDAIQEYEQSGRLEFPIGTLHRSGVRNILQARDQFLRMIQPSNASSKNSLLRCLFVAFADRLTRRREAGSRKGIMLGGRGAYLAASSAVMEGDLFVGIDVDAGTTETIIRQASQVERDWLPKEQLTTQVEVEFDPASERVVAYKRTRLEDLLIDETPSHFPKEETVAQVLAQAATKRLDQVLPTSDTPAGTYLLRLRCLQDWMPELNLPAFAEADLSEILNWICLGCRSFADVSKADWLSALQGRLSYAQQQIVEQEVPERIEVPSGSRIKLEYERGRPPILAVRIQELYGWTDTPRIAGGRIKVLLHLLAPNFRPQQVTDDLASFWANTYPIVRKELRARYPKHSWPENPLEADPQRKPGRR